MTMQTGGTRRHRFRGRVAILLLLFTVISVACAGRLVQIQVFQAHALDKQAAGKREVPVTLTAQRGRILDRNGKVLAETVTRYRLVIDQTVAAPVTTTEGKRTVKLSLNDIAAKVAAIVGGNAQDIRSKFTGKSRYQIIAQDLTSSQYTKLNDLGVSWFVFETTQKRIYPSGAVAGNLVGYLDGQTQPQSGVERMENTCLSGSDGKQTYERSATGIRLPGTTVTEKKVRNGKNVRLTIDRDLQWYVQQKLNDRQAELGSKWITATVMDAKTGELLVAAETPSVDPNNVTGVDASDRGSRIFQSTYEPGSPIKMITAVTALEQGTATAESKYIAPNSFDTGAGHSISDAWSHGPLQLTLAGILMYSSNTGIIQVGKTVSDESRYNNLQAFGFGQPSGIGFPAEASGVLHPWQKWDTITHFTTMFGQGMTATPIQMVSAYQALANGGVKVSPSLVASCGSKKTKSTSKRILPANVAKETIGMLEQIVYKYDAKPAQISGYVLAAKTGTSQIASSSGGYEKNHYVTSVMFIAPANNPRYVVGITVYDPQTEKTSAGTMTLAHDILTQVLTTEKVAPDNAQPVDDAVTW
ncbi:MAG: penicillin-binding protein 2 [Microbacteriaceae bacterium]|jgi:cell division protein FtsI (penicillin-binding protein 3)|nr:penicillin-binding protein 2 [Microbacteriaceae bacterium]MCI1207393.1 penicillin-binding protein 2 [Microbacteriaceae bacterium]